MQNDHVMPLTPADEDPVVHRMLQALPDVSPSPGFEDRVMAQVRIPVSAPAGASAPVVARAPRALRRWVAGFATAWAASFAGLVWFATANWAQLETAWGASRSWVANDAWRLMGEGFTTALTFVPTLAQQWGLTGTTALFAATGSVGVMMLSYWGLRRTIDTYDRERMSLHVSP